MTLKNEKFFLVFIDITLDNPFNGEIDTGVKYDEEKFYSCYGRHFVRGKRNTLLFCLFESILVIDFKK
jgi:hypothetical protein